MEASSIQRKQAALRERLEKIPNPQERLNALVLEYRNKQSLPTEFKTEAHRVEGCLSKLWFVAQQENGACVFRSDSDSLVVKAVAGLLCDFYSGQSPEEIVACDPSFLKELGITQHLTTNRRNGLTKVWESIRGFALSKMPGQVNLAELVH